MRKWLVILILLVGNLPMFAGEEKGGLGERREVVYRVDIKDDRSWHMAIGEKVF